jgi:cystathionine beta-lyase family protein involved in aluminum resistance
MMQTDNINEAAKRAEADCAGVFAEIDKNTEQCSIKVLDAFRDNRVAAADLNGTTGYGYDDAGREKLDKITAQVFGAEDALIRHNFTCGTHTLAVALYGVLRPSDTVLCVTGTPYDTIHPVFGLGGPDGSGSLADLGVKYRQVELKDNVSPDLAEIERQLKNDSSIRMVYVQRSRGYSRRPSLSTDDIQSISSCVHDIRPDAVVMTDNCYGEFTCMREPCDAGADLCAGSLIKNPGGGIARTGGYIAGRHDLVELCAYRLTTPGLGREVGATLDMNRELFMGLYNAPSAVGNALKTAVFSSRLFELLGYNVSPHYLDKRNDIVQQIDLLSDKALIAFCKGLQSASPVDSFATPEPWAMPGYDCDVIMAAGTFTLGSSIELSGDGPLKEPYTVFMQGGTNYFTAKAGVVSAAYALKK